MYDLSAYTTELEERFDNWYPELPSEWYQFDDLEDDLHETDRRLSAAVKTSEKNLTALDGRVKKELEALQKSLKAEKKKVATLNTKIGELSSELAEQRQLVGGMVKVLSLLVEKEK